MVTKSHSRLFFIVSSVTSTDLCSGGETRPKAGRFRPREEHVQLSEREQQEGWLSFVCGSSILILHYLFYAWSRGELPILAQPPFLPGRLGSEGGQGVHGIPTSRGHVQGDQQRVVGGEAEYYSCIPSPFPRTVSFFSTCTSIATFSMW